ncbi:Rmf/CrpP family protein [Streptomyces sp. NPDC050610]|uniref:ribosome modulation factor n=1 Tax=Streptomyces sp. NPDC050610 TaxID=3157097 RepID=UPI0034176E83
MAARGELVAALKEGRLAHELGEGSADCPYPAGHPLRAPWLRGFAAARSQGEEGSEGGEGAAGGDK